jgi:hypothetical protein
MSDEIWIQGQPGEVAFLSSLMRSQGIPCRPSFTHWKGNVSAIGVPGSHSDLARKLLKEHNKEHLRILTAEEYRHNQRLFLAYVLSIIAVAALLYLIYLKSKGA